MTRLRSASSESFKNWLIATTDICGDLSFQIGEPVECFGQIRREKIGELEMAHIRCQVEAIRRGKGNTDRGHDRHCFLILQRAGSMLFRDGRQSHRISAGEVALVDSAQEFEMVPLGAISHLSIHLDREAMFRAFPGGRINFGKVGLDSGCGRLLKSLIWQICSGSLESRATETDGEALQASLIELSRLSLAHSPSEQGSLPQASDTVRLALRARVDELISIHLCEPELTPQFIAAAMQISVRQLYRLFQDSEDGLHAYILHKRLRECAKELATMKRTITEICFDWGFSDSAHFSRVFKQYYDLSPRDYRLALRESALT